MTREKAIRIIETVFQDEYVYKYYDSITHQALDMAIEALKEQDVVEKLTQDLADKLNDAYAKGYKDAKREIAVQGRMAEFPTYEEMAKKVAETALDSFEYQGKTIKEWIKIITEQDWIPVSERLPEERGVYIVTEKVFNIHDREHKSRYNTKVEQVEYGNGKWQRASFFEIMAWMPLPEPYKEP